MTKSHISLEAAKLLGERKIYIGGYPSYAYYEYLENDEYDDPRSGDIIVFKKKGDIKIEEGGASRVKKHLGDAPEQCHLQKWLREEKQILVFVDYDYHAKIGYTFKVCYGKYPDEKEIYSNGELRIPPFKTYEEALEAGLIEALKLTLKAI